VSGRIFRYKTQFLKLNLSFHTLSTSQRAVLNREVAENIRRPNKAVSPTFFKHNKGTRQQRKSIKSFYTKKDDKK
jgi:uncharacterized SAM-dependent methyltransferase